MPHTDKVMNKYLSVSHHISTCLIPIGLILCHSHNNALSQKEGNIALLALFGAKLGVGGWVVCVLAFRGKAEFNSVYSIIKQNRKTLF